MRHIILLLTVLILLLFIGCKSQKNINTIAPKISANKTMLFSTTTSLLPVPISIHFSEIERQINANINGLIYDDNTYEDDDLKYSVWKTGEISFKESNGKIISSFPLKIEGTYRYSVSLLGLSDTKKFSMNGIISTQSDLSLNNWKLNSKSHITSIVWKKSPSIELFGKSVAVTYLVNPALYFMKKKLSNMIDEKIKEYGDLSPYVIEGIKKISEPILVNEEYESWFYLKPLELYSTEAIIKDNKININVGLKCSVKTSIGIKPKPSFDAEILTVKAVNKIPNDFNINLAAVSTYESAGKVITQNFKGIELGEGSKKISIEKVALWESENKIIIALDVKGSINGVLYLSGKPSFDKEKEEIKFEELDYELSTRNILIKTANWAAKGLILNKIKENCSYSLKSNLMEGKDTFDYYLNNYSPSEGIFINGKTHSLTFEKIEFNEKGIVAFMNAKGNMKISIEDPKLD